MAEPILGEIRLLAGSGIPPGWAACDGQVLTIKEHKDLYNVLGTTYGGDGKSTFALPDLRGRTPLHSSSGSMHPGTTGGESAHALSVAELPAHAHGSLGLIAPLQVAAGVQQVSAAPVAAAPAHTVTTTIATATSSSSNGAQHDNLQPYLAVTFVIALHGVAPSRK